jgi:hypothetical protein
MQRSFEILLELAKRPHLWDVENPDAKKIAIELQKEGVYKAKFFTLDQSISVRHYLKILLEMKKALKCQA